jgi:hypothetical protein
MNLRDGITPEERATWWALVGAARAWCDKPAAARVTHMRAICKRARVTVVPGFRDINRMRLFRDLCAAAQAAEAPTRLRELAEDVATILGDEPQPRAVGVQWWLEG